MDIKIGTFNYKLSESTEPLILNNQLCAGIIDYDNLKIEIKKDLNQQRKQQTTLHEVMHGILREYDIDIGNVDEEYLVDSLGTALYQVIKDNNNLIEYLRKEVN